MIGTAVLFVVFLLLLAVYITVGLLRNVL